jgi:hypothetical protein
VYEQNMPAAFVNKNTPMPFLFRALNPSTLKFNRESRISSKYFEFQQLKIWIDDAPFSILYSGLYKVDKIGFARNSLIGKIQTSKFIWGVELIHLILEREINELELSLEISYF